MPKSEINSVAVVGGGKMGRQIFFHLIKYPLQVRWINRSGAENEMPKLQKRFNRLLKNKLISRQEYDEKCRNILIAAEFPESFQYDLLIESITEDLQTKNNFFEGLAKRSPQHNLVVSNSSSFLPEKFQLTTDMKAHFACFHFFYPVQPGQPVEIIPTHTLNPSNTKKLLDFATAMDMKPLLQNEKTAFAANRFFLEIQSSLFNYCLAQNLEFALVDQLIRERLFPTGIFMAMDHIGFKILHQAIVNYLPMMEAPERILPMLDFIRAKMSNGHFGSQSGQGFLHDSLPETETEKPQLKAAIIQEVNTIFRRFAASYTEKGLITKEALQWVIEAYTLSDYDPFS